MVMVVGGRGRPKWRHILPLLREPCSVPEAVQSDMPTRSSHVLGYAGNISASTAWLYVSKSAEFMSSRIRQDLP